MIASYPKPTHRVGKFEFAIRRSEKAPDKAARAQALANWLLFEWHKEQEERRDETARDR